MPDFNVAFQAFFKHTQSKMTSDMKAHLKGRVANLNLMIKAAALIGDEEGLVNTQAGLIAFRIIKEWEKIGVPTLSESEERDDEAKRLYESYSYLKKVANLDK